MNGIVAKNVVCMKYVRYSDDWEDIRLCVYFQKKGNTWIYGGSEDAGDDSTFKQDCREFSSGL
jgi:hypothetical protein